MPEEPGNPDSTPSTDRSSQPGDHGDSPTGPPDTLAGRRAAAAEMFATAAPSTSGKPAAPIIGDPARWLRNASRGVFLVGLAAGWWLYRSDIAAHLERTFLPPSRAAVDLAQVERAAQQMDRQAPINERLIEERARNRTGEEQSAALQETTPDRGRAAAAATPSELPRPSKDDPTEARQALQRERERAEKLTRELDVVWRELRAQTATMADKAALDQELADLREALLQSEWQSATYEALLTQERILHRWLEEQLRAGGDGAPGRGPDPARNPVGIPDPPPVAAIDRAGTAPPDKSDPPVIPPGDRPPTVTARATAPEPVDPLPAPSIRGDTLSAVGSGASASDTAGIPSVPTPGQPATISLPEGEWPAMQTADEPAPPAVQTTAQDEPGTPETTQPARGDAKPGARSDGVIDPLQALDAPLVTAPSEPSIAPLPPDNPPTVSTVDEPANAAVVPIAMETRGGPELARLMARASLLLSQGNIGAARSVLERAAETGDAAALFALAETYDPLTLSAWGTFGTLGDVARAQELYRKAFAGGMQQAKGRLSRLP